MEFSIKNGNPEKQRNDCVIVGVFESHKLSDAAKAIDEASDGYLSAILKSGDMEGKLASTLTLHRVPNVASDRVLLVGLGKESEFDERAYRKAVVASIKALSQGGVETAGSFLAEITVKKHNTHWKAAQLVEVALDCSYRFEQFKSKKSEKKGIAKLVINVDKSDIAAAEAGLKQGLALAAGVSFAKDLGNLPPNVCTPTYLAEQAEALAKSHGIKVQVLERAEMEKLGMGSFLGVAQGSVQPPKLIVMHHNGGKKNQKPVVLVGKGITFDTGGISLKPGAEMDEMKYDMCGAASVLGTFNAKFISAMALNVPSTLAAPHISYFISSISAPGLSEIPPVSNVIPLPTSTTGF